MKNPTLSYQEETPQAGGSGLAFVLKLLSPGLGIKRWLLLVALGVLLIALGLAYLMAYLMSSPLPGFASPAVEAVVYMITGSALNLLAMAGLYRSMKSLMPSTRRGDNLAHFIYQKRVLEKGPRVVAIGGGTGLSNLLRGLKEHTGNITAIVTVADDGGSSGRLRRELGILPPGDFRNCLVALADAEPLMTRLFQYRFGQGSGLEGHSFGNLFIVAMSGVTGSFEEAIHESSRVLAVTGRILPATLANLRLYARMEDEALVYGESNITLRGSKIKQLFVEPATAKAYPEALQAIEESQLIILGPGSLYTSLLPNLLVKEVSDAIRNSGACKVYVCNVATQKGETDNYSVEAHVEAIQRHAGDGIFDTVVVNNNLYAGKYPDGRLESGAALVKLEHRPTIEVNFLEADLINKEFRLHHDPVKLASIVMEVYHNRHKSVG